MCGWKILDGSDGNLQNLRSRIANTWKPNRGVAIREIGGGRLLFQFYHKLNVKRVIEGTPWSLGNGPLILHQMKMGENPLSVPLNKLNFCVQIYDLPMGFFTERVGTRMSNFIDQFLEYDDSNRGQLGSLICESKCR